MTDRVVLCLASASPARLSTLRSAGVEPHVRVSSVDEDAFTAGARERYGPLAPPDVALLLARAKSDDVAAALTLTGFDGLVLGCDSVLELDGRPLGKPSSAQQARQWWAQMSGRSGILHTGHWLADLRTGGNGGALGEVSSTSVHFGALTEAEIAAYVATGEPLRAAGAFAIDGLGGPYVDRIEGDHHTVVGIGLSTLRRLIGQLGLGWCDLA